MQDTQTISAHDMPEEIQELMLDKVGGLIFQRVVDRCAEILPTEKQNTLAELLENKTTGFHTIIKYLEENVTNFIKVVQEEGSNVAQAMKN